MHTHLGCSFTNEWLCNHRCIGVLRAFKSQQVGRENPTSLPSFSGHNFLMPPGLQEVGKLDSGCSPGKLDSSVISHFCPMKSHI